MRLLLSILAILEARCFGSTQSGRICRGQGAARRLQARHRFEEAHNFIGPQHHRQLLRRLTRIRDPLRQIRLPERYPPHRKRSAQTVWFSAGQDIPPATRCTWKGPDVLQTKLVAAMRPKKRPKPATACVHTIVGSQATDCGLSYLRSSADAAGSSRSSGFPVPGLG